MKPNMRMIAAAAMIAGLVCAPPPAAARDWMSPQMRAAADELLAAMPDDYYTVKDVAAEKEIATGVPLVLDVREPGEFALEHIPRAQNLPLRSLVKRADSLPADKAAAILVYCKTGHRGAVALTLLRLLGYRNVRSIYGGLDGWKSAGFPVAK